MKILNRRLTAVLTVLVLGIAWSTAAAGDEIDYRLKWLFNASVVGDIYAMDQGVFDRHGLNVNVKPGGPERDAIKELELGYARFGVASADQVIRARAKGSPVVVLAQLFQVNPLQWIYRSSNVAIDSLEDLKGLTIGVTFGGNDENILRTLLAKAGLGERDVTLFSVRYDFTPFYQGRVDMWPVYRNTQGPIISGKLMAAGESVGFFNPADFGVRFVANSVVTSADTVKENPEMVEQFITALLTAWEKALDPANAARVLKMLEKYDRDTDAGILQKQLDITRDQIKPRPDIPIGTIDVEAWKQTEKIMLVQGQIEKPVLVEKALDARFVPRAED